MVQINRLMRREDGVGLVEMALVLPVFLLMVMGILDMGRGVMASHNVAEAARAGARYAVTAPLDCTGIKNAAVTNAPAIALTAAQVSVVEPSGANFGSPVTVSVNTGFTPVTPMIASFLPGGALTLKGASTMAIQYVGTGAGC